MLVIARVGFVDLAWCCVCGLRCSFRFVALVVCLVAWFVAYECFCWCLVGYCWVLGLVLWLRLVVVCGWLWFLFGSLHVLFVVCVWLVINVVLF